MRLFLKLVLVQEYSPKEIVLDFPNKSAVVILHSFRDLEEILDKYTEFVNYKVPDFLIFRYNPNVLQPGLNNVVNPLQPVMGNPMIPYRPQYLIL